MIKDNRHKLWGSQPALLKNEVEWIFWALLSCWHSYASCWFSWDILSQTKSLPENFRLLSSWDLLPKVLCLYITEFFALDIWIWLSFCLISSFDDKHISHLKQCLLQLMKKHCKCFLPKHLQWHQQAQGLTLLPLFYCIRNLS